MLIYGELYLEFPLNYFSPFNLLFYSYTFLYNCKNYSTAAFSHLSTPRPLSPFNHHSPNHCKRHFKLSWSCSIMSRHVQACLRQVKACPSQAFGLSSSSVLDSRLVLGLFKITHTGYFSHSQPLLT